MRGAAISLVFLCATIAHADSLQLGEMGFPFQNKNVEIIWQVASNRVQPAMKVYRVVPTNFSLQFITNLIALGGFKEQERVKNALVPAMRGKDAIWEEIPARKTISLSPRRGKAQFFDVSRRSSPKEPPHGVPSDDEVVTRAIKTAGHLGIKTSEIAKTLDSNQFLFRRDKRTMGGLLNGKYTERDTSRGIYLYRAFDGIPVYGNGNCGGLYFDFGNDGLIADFDLSWRNVEVKAVRPTADRNQLTKWIREGKAFCPDEELNPATVKRLTIRDVVAHYRGYPTDYDQPMVLPMAVIQATALIGDESKPVMLLSPLVSD